MNKINLLIIIFFVLTACGGFQEAGKVLRNQKTDSTDEFLVKKREPLVLPPDYNKIPEPNTKKVNKENEEKKRIKKILKSPEDTNTSNKSNSSTEESILNRIKK